MSDALTPVRIAGSKIVVEVLPAVGARLHRLQVFGHDVLRAPPDLARHRDDPYFWGSYPMAPWGGRVAAGRTDVAGRTVDLAATFPDGTAIHGQVSRRGWEQVDDGRFRVAGGGDGWPWPYEVEQLIAVEGDALVLDLRLTNRSDTPMPGGLGFHPWFRRPVAVAIDAAAVFTSNLASDPLPVPVAGPHDRRRLEPMPDDLDATWADVSDPPVILAWPDVGIRATMRVASAALFIVAASPAAIDAVAIEPQTHAPQGIRRLEGGEPGGLALVPPGESLQLGVRLAFERINRDEAPTGSQNERGKPDSP